MDAYQSWDHTEFLANGLDLKSKKDWKKFWRELWLQEKQYRFPFHHRKEWREYLAAKERGRILEPYSEYFFLIAITEIDCSPTGVILIGEQAFEAISEAGFISAHTKVRITGYDINLLKIRPLEI